MAMAAGNPGDPIAGRLLGWTEAGVPTMADADSRQSVAIADAFLVARGAQRQPPVSMSAQARGTIFEEELRTYLEGRLTDGEERRAWSVARGGQIADFVQFQHLAAVDKLVESDESGLLRNAIDYVIKPDVVVAFDTPDGPWLHASVSCKFTIRSDRVQNARHEANIMLRHRRGRAPHIVTVTAEPLPTRIASIARGTGEIDGTYHLSLDSLEGAVEAVGNPEQTAVLAELVGNARLFDLSRLPEHLLQ